MCVDDLLLAATTNEECLRATNLILQLLYVSGFKVSKENLQVSRPSVTFMGRLITAQGSTLSHRQRDSILSHQATNSEGHAVLTRPHRFQQKLHPYVRLADHTVKTNCKEQGIRHVICKFGSFHLFTSAAMEIG